MPDPLLTTALFSLACLSLLRVGDKLSFELSKSSLQAVEMALSGEQVIFPGKVCKGKRIKKEFGSVNGGVRHAAVDPHRCRALFLGWERRCSLLTTF